MDRQYVSSSNLRSVGFDVRTSVLEIEFNNGTVYQYFNVSETVYTGLMSASSKGSFFDLHVKKAGYRYQQIR
ncbi:TPA: KTSC domain-containing protein [Salmonella enterica]|uniref:KTSC domain-containing protein n=2 Tax=Salmonella enterica TaxID=28901 RepID=A0A3V8I9E4_SALER|nr:KTSC domain-containing protein [Salmonella enterica]ECC3554046.1 KTSC domain-containing protein [Salmonella enterica subsp. salamae]HCM1853277.1 KTSC domain-containing protein [Salmonella enterica subsp. salamae serovar 42:z29:-]AZT25065.1 KTSC domain-containing protein [Salmonella enterica subsp. salamae serovar 42:r:-]AZT51297.1 KTSC domain-containing protein [Salmonella enterica subsp. salamae serovar 42:r:-]AZT55722.1 KTSC domain-containing protein [Salmonella enterica subsp. salamae se